MGCTREDIIRTVEEEEIEFIRLQFTDIFGQLKNVAITASQIEKAVSGGVMFDGSSIEGFTRIYESDQRLCPDLDTFAVFPWRPSQGKVARMICDVYNQDGTPFVGDPRQVLKREIRKARDMGFDIFNIGPELEFFLFETDDQGRPTTQTRDEAGYFDLGPLDHGESTRREVCMNLEQMGFIIEASHHECARGQHEIDFHYVDALDGADKIMTMKLAIKTLAQKNGLHATFMPKPIYGVAGSGMHLNMSLFKDGRNVFCDESGEKGISGTARCFIAGILDHAGSISALTNPLVNSYKRLGAGYEAPRYISWSASNRSTLIRIPADRGHATRVELRSPDPACNPYLAIAVCLAAGLDGIARHLEPPPEVSGDMYEPGVAEGMGLTALPESLKEALDLLEQDPLILDVLGSHIAEHYIAGKRREWQEYQTRVSSWEIDKYLVAY